MWSIQAPKPKPECNAKKDCPPLSLLSAPPRTPNSRTPRMTKKPDAGNQPGQILLAYFNQIVPYLRAEKRRSQLADRLQIFVSFPLHCSMNSKICILNALDGIADAAPESASIKWTLMNRICHYKPSQNAEDRTPNRRINAEPVQYIDFQTHGD